MITAESQDAALALTSRKAPPIKPLPKPTFKVDSSKTDSTTKASAAPSPNTPAPTKPDNAGSTPAPATSSSGSTDQAASNKSDAPASVSVTEQGKVVLDFAHTMHGKPYCWLFSGKAKGCKGLSLFSSGNTGYLSNLEATTKDGKATLYKADSVSKYGTYCSSYTFQVAFLAANKLGLLSKMSKRDIEMWRQMWFGASKASVAVDGAQHSALLEQSTVSLPAFKLGRRLASLADAQPGDFVQINRNDKGAGHSVIFVDHVKDSKARIVGFKYIAANESNGVSYAQVCFDHHSVPSAPELAHGEDDAYHAACKGYGTAEYARVYVGRLGN